LGLTLLVILVFLIGGSKILAARRKVTEDLAELEHEPERAPEHAED